MNVVKIADFGLSDFYRPGAVMKSSCGTLSFLAPEVFKGTANAGPPLDVWAMGVILFALLCGRLPFEGPDLIGTKRPRDAVIKSRIMKCQYKLDDNLGMEAKVRRFASGLFTPPLQLYLTLIIGVSALSGPVTAVAASRSRRAYHCIRDLQSQLGAHGLIGPFRRSFSSVSTATTTTATAGHHIDSLTHGERSYDACRRPR